MTTTEQEMMTPDECAQLLRISKSTLSRMTNAGRIPHLRISDRCVRYERAVINAWKDREQKESVSHG